MFAFQFEQLNRHGELRQDAKFINDILNKKNCYFLPVYKQFFSAHEDSIYWLNKQLLTTFVKKIQTIHLIYLGEINDNYYFSYRLNSSDELQKISPLSNNLRSLLPFLSQQDAYLANVATAMNQWHTSHQHCGQCGAETYSADAGYVRKCSSSVCGLEHFPRTDPAIIVAITHTDDQGIERLLLGRQSSWPEKRYSVIAGFVEPGESLEQAVAREADEEVGISIEKILYQASQPWPFPQSIMLGFTAKAVNSGILLKDKELEDAQWFSAEDINQLTAKEELLLPYKFSISRMLVEQWRNAQVEKVRT